MRFPRLGGIFAGSPTAIGETPLLAAIGETSSITVIPEDTDIAPMKRQQGTKGAPTV